MGFVYERVAKEDWELYNSFEIKRKVLENGKKEVIAGEHSHWLIDRDKKIYGIMTDILGREGIEYFTFVINGKHVDVVANIEGKTVDNEWKNGYRLSEVSIDDELVESENEVLTNIKVALQTRWGEDEIFIDIENVKYKGGKWDLFMK